MSLISSSRWKGQVAGNSKKYWRRCPACRARVLQICPLFNPKSPTNPMLTEWAVSSSGLSWPTGTSCQSSQASLSRTFQELTWRTGHTAKCFLQQLAWKTALLCKLDWTQGCHSVPWRLHSSRVVAHSNLNHWLILVYFFQLIISAASPAFPAKVLWKMIMPRMRSRKQKWWSRKYRERFCERDIWVWWSGHYVFSTAHLALHQQTLAISIEFKFDLQKSHAMLLLTMFFFIS